MEANLTLVITAAALIGCGVYLLLERSLSRVLMGLILMSNGVSLAFLVSAGPAGDAPIVGAGDPGELADPLPQAMVLTAIVITLATTAFLLAMAYRSWQLNGHDDVQDDVEDAAIRRLALTDDASDSYDLSSAGENDEQPLEEGA
ncbi:Na(+)/H(+) antiporter subunit C [Nocardioides pacificus]